jgi:hypothetical protein
VKVQSRTSHEEEYKVVERHAGETIGVDLGDKLSHQAIVDPAGVVVGCIR